MKNFRLAIGLLAVAFAFILAPSAQADDVIRDRLGRPVAKVATCVGGTCQKVYDRVGRPVAKVVKTAGKVVVYDRLGRRR
jgi:hypothetical protein